MLNMKRISESYEMKVFTDAGDYFGDVEEAILTQSKITGWRVRATIHYITSRGTSWIDRSC